MAQSAVPSGKGFSGRGMNGEDRDLEKEVEDNKVCQKLTRKQTNGWWRPFKAFQMALDLTIQTHNHYYYISKQFKCNKESYSGRWYLQSKPMSSQKSPLTHKGSTYFEHYECLGDMRTTRM